MYNAIVFENEQIMARRRDAWVQKVEEPKDTKVFEALSNPSWTWRTIESLSSESNLSVGEVYVTLKHHKDLVCIWPTRGKQGEIFFTLKSEPTTFREGFLRTRVYFEKYYREQLEI